MSEFTKLSGKVVVVLQASKNPTNSATENKHVFSRVKVHLIDQKLTKTTIEPLTLWTEQKSLTVTEQGCGTL